jgi:hypothetical protein
MTERFVERLGGFTNRRRFLRRGGAAAVGAAAVLTSTNVATSSAHPSSTHGCDLCRSPSSCSYVCSWCWWGRCHTNVGGGSHHQTLCCEGYATYFPCSGGCRNSGLVCSFYGGNRGC